MIAHAPGKLVLSGAYAVLSGAPAVVSAVDRYVTANSQKPAEFVTDEVAAAGLSRAPWFDASALRSEHGKLGLGSSAAILVASMAALLLEQEPELSPWQLAKRLELAAIVAHRRAQGGGSGIDVLSACRGGTQLVRRAPDGTLTAEAHALPEQLCFELWAASKAASTALMLQAIAALRGAEPALHQRRLGAQSEAAERAASALTSGDARGWLEALRDQGNALHALGKAAGVPIVTPELRLAQVSLKSGALLPAGAGGGDVAIYFGTEPLDAAIADQLIATGHHRVEAKLGATGVASCPSS